MNSAVTPLAGVWIEIANAVRLYHRPFTVTPLAGVWIEIYYNIESTHKYIVTPLAGVWIEISMNCRWPPGIRSHTPRGCVD